MRSRLASPNASGAISDEYNLAMLPFTKSNWVALTGLVVAAAGIVLYTQLDRVGDLGVSFAVLDGVALGSIVTTLCGLLTATVGSVIWARRVSTNHILSASVLICAAVVLVVSLVNVNIHNPSAILIFVIPFGVLDAGLLFLIVGLRWGK